MAQEYIDEMGNIADKFAEYKNKYNTRAKILSNEDTCIEDTKKIISQIRTRMGKEEGGLYNFKYKFY